MIRKVITDVLADQSVTSTKLHNNIISGLTSLSNIDTTNDLILVFDANTSTLKKANFLNIPASVCGGTGVGYDAGTGEISIGQAVATTSNVTFNNVTVDGVLNSDDVTASNVYICGDLTVTGTTTTVNSTTVDIADKNINLACTATNSAQADGGGINLTGAGACIHYSSTYDTWNFNKCLCATKLFGQITDISNHDTDNLSQGSTNLYFSNTLARASLCGAGDITYCDTTGQISVTTYKTANFDTDFATKSVGNLCDVDITTTAPTCGQALVYNDTSCKFLPGTVASGGGSGTGISIGLAIALG